MNVNESEDLKPIKQPSAATNKANGLAAQANAIDAASIGGAAFLSAKTFLATNPKAIRYQE